MIYLAPNPTSNVKRQAFESLLLMASSLPQRLLAGHYQTVALARVRVCLIMIVTWADSSPPSVRKENDKDGAEVAALTFCLSNVHTPPSSHCALPGGTQVHCHFRQSQLNPNREACHDRMPFPPAVPRSVTRRPLQVHLTYLFLSPPLHQACPSRYLKRNDMSHYIFSVAAQLSSHPKPPHLKSRYVIPADKATFEICPELSLDGWVESSAKEKTSTVRPKFGNRYGCCYGVNYDHHLRHLPPSMKEV